MRSTRRDFDLPTQEQIERWVCRQAAVGLSPGEIFPLAEETLRLWDVVLPARSTLERLVASQAARAQEEIFQRLSARLSAECCADLDSLLEVGEDVPRSALLRLKEYPPEATAATILSYLQQYALLRLYVALRRKVTLTGQTARSMTRRVAKPIPV